MNTKLQCYIVYIILNPGQMMMTAFVPLVFMAAAQMSKDLLLNECNQE